MRPTRLPWPPGACQAPSLRSPRPSVVLSGLLLLAAAVSAQGENPARAILEGAHRCVAKAPRYDGRYVPLAYPGGDPGWEIGVCTDVVIRSFRHAGIDLQRLVHEDILRAPEAYRITRPDPSIDHRRVRNLAVFFRRHARSLPLDADWRPGDIVIWSLSGSGYPNHIGIVAETTGPSGHPLVYHHFPRTALFSGHPEASDCLHLWRILHHFRWQPHADPPSHRTQRGTGGPRDRRERASAGSPPNSPRPPVCRGKGRGVRWGAFLPMLWRWRAGT